MSDDLVKRLRDLNTFEWHARPATTKEVCFDAAARIEKLEAALRSVPKIVEFGFEHYKGCVDIKITREVELFVQKALEGKDG